MRHTKTKKVTQIAIYNSLRFCEEDINIKPTSLNKLQGQKVKKGLQFNSKIDCQFKFPHKKS